MTHRSETFRADENERLGHQWRDFHDADGTVWHARIEQGGGTRSVTPDAAPDPVVIFRVLDGDVSTELAIGGDAGEWNLASYSESRLRALLVEAQVHARESVTE